MAETKEQPARLSDEQLEELRNEIEYPKDWDSWDFHEQRAWIWEQSVELAKEASRRYDNIPDYPEGQSFGDHFFGRNKEAFEVHEVIRKQIQGDMSEASGLRFYVQEQVGEQADWAKAKTRTTWGDPNNPLTHDELFILNPQLYNGIVAEDSAWSMFDKYKAFPLQTYIEEYPDPEDRAADYIELSLFAASDPDMLTPWEWALLNVAQHDIEARPYATKLQQDLKVLPEIQEQFGSIGNTWEDRYGDSAMNGYRRYVLDEFGEDSDVFGRFDRGMEWGQLNSFFQAEPFSTTSKTAGYIGEFAAIVAAFKGGRTNPVGSAPASAGRMTPLLPAGRMSAFYKSPLGQRINSYIMRVATTPWEDRKLREKFSSIILDPRTGPQKFLAGTVKWGTVPAGIAVGNTIGDFVAVRRDAAEQNRRMNDRQLRADMQKAGLEITEAGQASGEGEMSAYYTEVIRTPDGKVLSWDEVPEWMSANGHYTEAVERYVTTNPNSAPATTTTAPLAGDTTNAEPAGWVDELAAEDDTAPTTPPQGEADELTPERDPYGIGSGPEAIEAAGTGGRISVEDARGAQEDEDDPFFGVPSDYSRGGIYDTFEGSDYAQRYEGEFDDYTMYGTPRYRKSASSEEISSWHFSDIIDFQEKAIAARLIDPEKTLNGQLFRPGIIDEFTVRALETAMEYANIEGNGVTYREMMEKMEKSAKAYEDKYGTGDGGSLWSPPTAYAAPDYAAISQGVKNTFASKLGRDPNDWEMDLLADQFRSDHRAAYDARMQADENAFHADGRIQETGELEYPDAVQEIDPYARLAENFDQQFESELNAKDRWADVQSKSRNLFGSFDKLSRA